MKSIYHILHKVPAIAPENIPTEYEGLAQELISSGRIRIDTDYYCNFVRYTDNTSSINVIVSYEELAPELIKATKENIRNLYRSSNKAIDDSKIFNIISNLNKKASKLLLVDAELKLQIARIFVQSAHPIVIRWLILDKVEIFVTYSHNIGDLMDIVTWKKAGSNSGMQSTDGKNVCIYVSCGGDPFAPNNELSLQVGSGWAALARFQIIAAQEIGHFADIVRDNAGRQITRHSCDFACTAPKEHVTRARKKDVERSNILRDILNDAGMAELINIETKLKFYAKQKISGLKIIWLKLLAKYYRYRLVKFAISQKLFFIKLFYKREKYMGLMIAAMIEDMLANLSPIADVYKRDDPAAEEAIRCAEALARVPQQVMKWGHLTTSHTMRDLYYVYYSEVIPSLVNSYKAFTTKEFKRDYLPPKKTFKNILAKFNIFKAKGSNKFVEVRDL